MHLVGMFDFMADTYFNRRNRRSKQVEGWLFASDQNLIFIQSGGKPTAPEGVTATSNSLFPLTSITHSIFVLLQESIKKIAAVATNKSMVFRMKLVAEIRPEFFSMSRDSRVTLFVQVRLMNLLPKSGSSQQPTRGN